MDALKTQFPAHDFTLLGLILLMPLVGAVVNGVFGKRLGREGVRAMAKRQLNKAEKKKYGLD